MTEPIKPPIGYRTPAEQKELDKLLDQLGSAEKLRKRHAMIVNDTVAMLRAEALDGSCLGSWEAIGAMLGITRQAAQQRFNRYGIR